MRVSGQPPYVPDLRLRDARPVIQQYVVPRLFEPVHIPGAGAYAVCKNSIRRDPYCGPVADTVDPVVCKLLYCFHLATGGCPNAEVAALQLVRREDLDAGCSRSRCATARSMWALRLRGFITRKLV
jgi:hypothetical protein